MVDGTESAELVYVRGDHGGQPVERLRSELDSVSVTVVDDLSSLADRLDSDVDCVVARHDLPDGSGFDVHDVVRRSPTPAPVVLLADVTDDVAARAVARDLAGLVPLSADLPTERLVETVDRAVAEAFADETPLEDAAAERKADVLDQLLARAPVHLYVKDENARHVLVSEALVDDPSSLLGQSDLDSELVPTEEARGGYEDDLAVLETGDPIIDRQEYYPSRDEWYLTSKVPRYDEDGDIVGLIGVSREITEHRKTQARLEAVNERLERFVSVVSHDLRNPLTIARGRIDIERDRNDTEHLAAIDRALARMESLIDDLLTLARGTEDIERTDRLQLSTVARSCWDDVPTDGATLSVDEDLDFRGAHGRVRQLLENLFRNAVEHGTPGDQSAPDDDPVSVRVGALEGADGFFVADDGPGIPAAQRDTVFESGYTTRESGTGFGLSIVADVAQAHGWSVAVTESESGGARFAVSGVDTLDT